MRLSRPYLFLAALCGILLFPHLHLSYFAPYIASLLYRLPRGALLWRALACGLLIDLLSTSPSLGITALDYLIVALLLQSQRRHFFEDKASTLFLLTLLFSGLSSLMMVLLLRLFSPPLPPLSLSWFFTDIVAMSCLDGLYALLLLLPFSLFRLCSKMYPKRKARL